MSTIETAIKLVVEARAGQRHKSGRPYLLLPLCVMQRFTDKTLQIVAVLHAVLGHTSMTAQDLQRLSFCDEVINALQSMSKQEAKSTSNSLAVRNWKEALS